MRKIIAIFSCLAILIFAVGCEQSPIYDDGETLKPNPDVSTQPTGDPLEIAENLHYVSMPISRVDASTEDYTTIFEYTYQTMVLTVPDVDVAKRIIVDFQTRMYEYHANAESLYEQARLDYTGASNWVPYNYRVLFSPTRIDQGVLSLCGEKVQYSGTSHSSRIALSASYDMVTGDVLTLGSILYHLDSKDELCNLVLNKLNEIRDSAALYENYEDTVRAAFDGDESINEAFYFTTTGLCFYFAPYEIAPYSSGTVIVSIPYEQLTGIIGDQFFPVERQRSSGYIEAHLFSEDDYAQYEQFAEITTDAGGEKILLYTAGVVNNISIRSGTWNEEGTSFITESIIFMANVLNPTDAIVLETYIPDADPNLLLTYESGGTTYNRFITQSGEDSSIILSGAGKS